MISSSSAGGGGGSAFPYRFPHARGGPSLPPRPPRKSKPKKKPQPFVVEVVTPAEIWPILVGAGGSMIKQIIADDAGGAAVDVPKRGARPASPIVIRAESEASALKAAVGVLYVASRATTGSHEAHSMDFDIALIEGKARYDGRAVVLFTPGAHHLPRGVLLAGMQSQATSLGGPLLRSGGPNMHALILAWPGAPPEDASPEGFREACEATVAVAEDYLEFERGGESDTRAHVLSVPREVVPSGLMLAVAGEDLSGCLCMIDEVFRDSAMSATAREDWRRFASGPAASLQEYPEGQEGEERGAGSAGPSGGGAPDASLMWGPGPEESEGLAGEGDLDPEGWSSVARQAAEFVIEGESGSGSGGGARVCGGGAGSGGGSGA